ncbi:MAG: homoserine kinase [Actinomycetota bacterium]|nr:homoserine kinase [Actinomycetota bacterium]
MKVRVPASSANLGPGYDTLGLALSLYVTVEVREADTLSVVARGEGAGLPVDEDHLAVSVARSVTGHSNLAISIDSEIPLARGLGSSAALAVAVAAAAGAYDAFVVASDVDGHCENAGASYLGGLVAGARAEDGWEVVSLPIDPRISAVVIIPEAELPTKDARAAVPKAIPTEDAVLNLQHLAMLMAGLADLDRLHPTWGVDRIHEPAREQVFPLARTLKELLLEAGARIATWSGAGSSVIGIFERDEAHGRADAIGTLLDASGIAARALPLEVDREGLVVLDDAP